VRAGLRALLEKLAGVEVVGEAGDGEAATRLAESTHPDVVLMDVAMPGFGGLDATQQLLRASPQTRVIMVSVHADPESVLRAIEAGACGYVLKDSGVAELELAIRSAMQGGTFLSPRVSSLVIEGYRRRAAGEPGDVAAGAQSASEQARL